ncbi:MAG TPA: GNAT family N-acetyltransferase [Verrucomicrobiae bacterium]|nr:GNAT family N-acetyltransferase [Verrucomicrobiae bacterium]
MADQDPWLVAEAAALSAGVTLRELDRADDGFRIDEVTRAIWGTSEVAPPLARAMQHAGAILVGAEAPTGELVGCALGFIAYRDGWHCHSHLAAVLPRFEGRGVGRALKLGQRAACLALGVPEMRWTYDPLLVRNAWFNLVRLGAVATAFLSDFYGAMDDLQNQGDRGDRLEVRWWLPAPSASRQGCCRGGPRLLDAVEVAGRLEPHLTDADPGERAEIQIPPDYPRLRRESPDLASRWRSAAAAAFTRGFAAGLVATAISREGVYRLTRPQPSSPVGLHPAAAGGVPSPPGCTIPRSEADQPGGSP